MKIKSFYILLVSILLISTAVFTVRVPVAHGICQWSLVRVVGVLWEVVARGGSKAEIEGIIRQIQTYATVCDDEGNAVTGVPVTVSPTVPLPYISGAADTDESVYADQVTSIAAANCFYSNPSTGGTLGGVVTVDNVSCLNNFSSIMSSVAIEKFKEFVTRSRTYFEQCVICARGFAEARGRTYEGYGNAKEHAGQSVPGYTYYSNSSSNYSYFVPGVLFISTSGTYGHIGNVTKVYYDSNNQIVGFKAFECNYGTNGLVSHGRNVPISSIAGWQKPDSL